MNPPVVLTIAGSDSSGGAGLQADLRTFAAHRVHGASALTLVSSQNTAEFRSAVPMPPGMILSQIEAVLDDMAVAATKTGLLFTDSNIAAVATIAEHARLPLLVVDPVMVGMGGRHLYEPEAEQLMAERLVPAARIVTPNHLEAGILVGRELADDTAVLIEAAQEIRATGPEVVIITGGRRSGISAAGEISAVDVVCSGQGIELLTSPWIETANVRGSGDTFSAAIVARLASGDSALAAVRAAHKFTAAAIAGAAGWQFGAGQGPLDHFGWASAEAAPGDRT
ncbi:MAG: bifunctional hydroxymethylpyrimidine kinase/phosphomethylpyrimidine kinase [Acidimicrobiales bacterium]|jgi:hydroxymethylpyrimidine/phosphomethylpyrimidine kinase